MISLENRNSTKSEQNTPYNDSSYSEHMPIKITTRATLKVLGHVSDGVVTSPAKGTFPSSYIPEFRFLKKCERGKKIKEKI